jgi:hypothetical protein
MRKRATKLNCATQPLSLSKLNSLQRCALESGLRLANPREDAIDRPESAGVRPGGAGEWRKVKEA